MLIRDGGVIAAGYDQQLDELRALSQNADQFLIDLEQREQQATGISNLKVAYNRVHGYYIEISKQHSEQVPPAYVRRQTLKAAERYITEELKTFEDQVLGARERALAREKALYEALLDALLEAHFGEDFGKTHVVALALGAGSESRVPMGVAIIGGLLLGTATDLTHHDNAAGGGIRLELFQTVNEIQAMDGIPTDAHGRRLPQATLGQRPDDLIRQGAAARHAGSHDRAGRPGPRRAALVRALSRGGPEPGARVRLCAGGGARDRGAEQRVQAVTKDERQRTNRSHI